MRHPVLATSILLSSTFFLGIGTASAQAPEPKPRRMSLAYFGDNVVNPGVRLGYELALWYRQPHELLIGANVGGYGSVATGDYALFIYGEGGYRLTTRVGLFFEARIGLGYSSYTKHTFDVQPDGSLAPGPNASANYLMPLALGGAGYDFYKRLKVPLNVFAQVGGLGRYTQNEPFSGGLLFTAGLAYLFGTTKPKMAELPVPATPIAEAPGNLVDPIGGEPAQPQPPSQLSPVPGLGETPAQPLAPVPELPPPPTVEQAPPASTSPPASAPPQATTPSTAPAAAPTSPSNPSP